MVVIVVFGKWADKRYWFLFVLSTSFHLHICIFAHSHIHLITTVPIFFDNSISICFRCWWVVQRTGFVPGSACSISAWFCNISRRIFFSFRWLIVDATCSTVLSVPIFR